MPDEKMSSKKTKKSTTKKPVKKTVKKKTTAKRIAVKEVGAKKPAAKKKVVRKRVVKKPVKRVVKKPVKRIVKKTAPKPSPSLNIYRHIALGFILVVVAMLMAVLYLSLMKAEITVTSVHDVVETEFVVDVVPIPTKESQIEGKVLAGVVGKTQAFIPSGEGALQLDDIATGTLTIINESSSSQPLVKTTRFLTPDGTLFRLSDGVTVPANGSIDAEVYADVEGVSGNIEPTTFTIPGLSEAKQALIYAQSSTAFTGGVRTISVVSEEEMTLAAQTTLDQLIADAKSMLRTEAGESFNGESFFHEVLEQTTSIEPNTEADSYEVTLSVKVAAVFFDQNALEEIAVRKLYEELGRGYEFISIDEEGMVVEVERYDAEEGTANIHVMLNGKSIASRTSEALSADRFIGMTAGEIETLLTEEGVATDVTVEFSPFFLKKVPSLKDHICITIE